MVDIELLNIGIDLDNVILQSFNGLEQYIIENNIKLTDKERFDISVGKVRTDAVRDFMDNHIVKANRCLRLMPGALSMICSWKNDGHSVTIITARGSSVYARAEIETYECLKEYGIPYDAIVFNAHNKAQVCKDRCISVHIDDSFETCRSIMSAGLNAILFHSPLNERVNDPITRAHDWIELDEIIVGMARYPGA